MWSLFFRGAPAAPTPLSPEQKAAAAFNELSAYITADMISAIKSQYSSSTAVAEGSDTVKLARIDEIAARALPYLRNAIRAVDISTGTQYSSNNGLEQLLTTTALLLGGKVHDLHYGFDKSISPTVSSREYLLRALRVTNEGKQAFEKWADCYSFDGGVPDPNDHKNGTIALRNYELSTAICETIQKRQIGDCSEIKFIEVDKVISGFRTLGLDRN